MPDRSAVDVNEFGQVRGQGIHDASITQFRYADQNYFSFGLRGTDGIERFISLLGLALVGFRDLANGTIVHDIYAWKLDGTDAAIQRPSREGWQALYGERYSEGSMQAEMAAVKRRYDSHFFMLLESSYGGSIAAICREIVWTDRLD